MDSVEWLAAVSAIIWSGIGIYLAFLAFSQRKLRERIKLLETSRDEEQG